MAWIVKVLLYCVWVKLSSILLFRLRAVSEGVLDEASGDIDSESDCEGKDEKVALHQLLRMEDGIVRAERKRKQEKKKRKKQRPKEGRT